MLSGILLPLHCPCARRIPITGVAPSQHHAQFEPDGWLHKLGQHPCYEPEKASSPNHVPELAGVCNSSCWFAGFTCFGTFRLLRTFRVPRMFGGRSVAADCATAWALPMLGHLPAVRRGWLHPAHVRLLGSSCLTSSTAAGLVVPLM